MASLIILGLLVAAGSGCETTERAAARRPTPTGGGRLIVTLNGPARSPIDLTVELSGILLHARGGGWVAVPVPPVRLNSLELVGRQVPLVDASVPAGQYDQIRLRFGTAVAREAGKLVSLTVPAEGFGFPVSLEVEPGAVAPLFAVWEVDRAIENETSLAPAFAFEGKSPEVRAVVAYVTNEESGTLSLLDRAKDQVVSVVQTGRAPRAVVVEPDTRRAFVLNGGEDTMSVLDVNTHRVIHRVNLEAQARAQALTIGAQGQAIYVANTGLNSVTVLDAGTFGTAATIPVGIAPVAVAADPRGARVLAANQGSNSVSVIDTFTNRVVTTVTVEAGPVHIAVDPNPVVDRAYVASPSSGFLTVLSASTGQVVRRLGVGPGVVAVVPDTIANRLFLVKQTQNRVVVFDAALNVELGSFAVGLAPHRIVLDPDRDKLYVVNRGGNSVTVADRLSRRVEATIPVGKRPSGIAIVR